MSATRTLAAVSLFSLVVFHGVQAQTPGTAPGANENGTLTPGATTTAVTGVHISSHGQHAPKATHSAIHNSAARYHQAATKERHPHMARTAMAEQHRVKLGHYSGTALDITKCDELSREFRSTF